MNASSEKILAEQSAFREKCRNLTRNELEKQYHELEQKGFPVSETISYAAAIGYSTCLAYHYELIVEDWKRPPEDQIHIGLSFEKHGEEGREYLFPVLQHQEAGWESVCTVYLLAEILNHSDNLTDCERLIPWLTVYASDAHAAYRRKALIALGWIGKEREIRCITGHLLTDEDPLCQAWAATAMMQMSFHHVPDEILRDKTIEPFRNGLKQERDLFVLGCMIVSIQTLWNKKWD